MLPRYSHHGVTHTVDESANGGERLQLVPTESTNTVATVRKKGIKLTFDYLK